ncbi:MAG TPA: RpiB/LacA/LacB family sugar-phosphate isomerase [Kofleriaceae bacterium]
MLEAVDSDRLHYLSSAELVCREVQDEPDSFGILICGTGMGMSIAANKFRGIYAARCTTVDDAEASRTINNANVLCLAAKMGFAHNAQIIEAFIRTPYTGRKLEELEYITEIETSSVSVGAARSIVRRTA